MDGLVFLKLGGSLITDKTRPYTPRRDKISQLAKEIESALSRTSDLRLVLGHGSGSFGHYAVKEHLPSSTTLSNGQEYWRGFAEVWYRASQLNRHVMDALHEIGVSAVSFPPAALVHAKKGIITDWDMASLKTALDAGIMPVIYGDIVFDVVDGGAILSTERLMAYLARHLPPQRVLLAGLEKGVWADFPRRHQMEAKITPSIYSSLVGKVGSSQGTDVTGGMRTKVEDMLSLVIQVPKLRIQIFSGEETGNVEKALQGEMLGTLIQAD